MEKEASKNERAETTLVALAKDGRFPHALLLEGENKAQQTALIKQIAAAVFCRDRANAPCGVCNDCHKVQENIHPDLLIYGEEGGIKSFHIDVIREIRMSAYILPNDAEKKIYVLYDGQNMTIQAQNALLKLVEEPPAHCIFILTCDNRSKLLPTILSRVMLISRDGEKETCNEDITKDAMELLSALARHDEYSMLCILLRYEKARENLSVLLTLVREQIARDITGANSSKGEERKFTALQGVRIADIIEQVQQYSIQNVNMTLLTTYIASQFTLASF